MPYMPVFAVMLPTVMGPAKVTFPAVPPKIAESGVPLFQLVLTEPFHQFEDVVSHVPVPPAPPGPQVISAAMRVGANDRQIEMIAKNVEERREGKGVSWACFIGGCLREVMRDFLRTDFARNSCEALTGLLNEPNAQPTIQDATHSYAVNLKPRARVL